MNKPLILNGQFALLHSVPVLRPRSNLLGERMRKTICGASVLLLVAACDQPVSTVVLDSAQLAEQAKATCANAQNLLDKNAGMISQLTCAHINSCVESTAIVAACGADITSNLRALETDITSEMTGNAQCKGVHFVQAHASAESKKEKQPHWALNIHFTPGKNRHVWEMLRSTDNALVQGEGGAREIAQRVCALATGVEAPK